MSSAREREILERQRRLAASLSTTAPASVDATNTTGNDKKSSAPAHNLPFAPTAPPLRRPTTKKPSSSMAILAAARASAEQNKPQPLSITKPEVITIDSDGEETKQKQSPRVVRKGGMDTAAATSTINSSKSALASTKLLSQLVQNATATSSASNDTDVYAAGFSTIQPEDFWKSLREWDVFTQYYKVQHSIPLYSNTSNKKPLPDVFINSRHYMAAWAPLCLAECKAQLLQEIPATATGIPVKCQVNNNGTRGGGNGRKQTQAYYDNLMASDIYEDAATIVSLTMAPPSFNGQGAQAPQPTSGSFTTNDLIILLTLENKDLLRDLHNKRTPRSLANAGASSTTAAVDGSAVVDFSRAGLVGHVEQSRASIQGLIIKVSKRKWAQIGQANMIAIPWKGGNVTALREFTALCRMETLPLKRYLLGQHLVNGATGNNNTRQQALHRLSSQQLLNEMGGRDALGKGFVEYATNKFNNSQLTAIAASANQYGDGGFTLIKGPPGTGKTTTLVACLNSLHIRQYNKYYEEVRRIAALPTGTRSAALEMARKAKPRLLCCAPSNAAVDNIIIKIMEDGFIDGQGRRYNPSIIRVGIGQSPNVRPVALETKVDSILSEHMDVGKLESSIAGYKSELSRITLDIAKLRKRCQAIATACPWPLSRNWEIRINEETFDDMGSVFFVNHKEQSTSYEVPPPPEPGETHFPATSMPEYRAFMARIVKLVESYFTVKTHLERCTIIKGASGNGFHHFEIQQNMETHLLNSVHIVMTTLGSAGGRALEGVDKFEVIVIDEAAQSVEPQSLSALQLGNRHAVLVGDPQQLPATIFNVSGKTTKYDRSLFQRLEEAGEPVYMLNEQYRMHPKISHFPRHIFYDGTLLDGPNVKAPNYGNPLLETIRRAVPAFQPFTVLDLNSSEERGGTSLKNPDEAELAVYLYSQLKEVSGGLSAKTRVAVITPYAQQSKLLQRYFENALGPRYTDHVEVNTVDAFQGREANIVIFSAVRASGSHGIGFLADVRRMNVALTRAKYMLFVIARCESIIVNPYWRDLVEHARETRAVVRVPASGSGNRITFDNLTSWIQETSSSSSPANSEQCDNADKSVIAHENETLPAKQNMPNSKKASVGRVKSRPADPRKRDTSAADDGDPPKQQHLSLFAAKLSDLERGGVSGSSTQPADPRKPPPYKKTGNISKPIDPRRAARKEKRKQETEPPRPPEKPEDPRKRGRGYQL